MHQFEMRPSVPEVRDSLFLRSDDGDTLVIYPTHAMPVRAPKDRLEHSDASEVGARSGDNQ